MAYIAGLVHDLRSVVPGLLLYILHGNHSLRRQHFSRLRCHEFIELRILRELILEWNDAARAEEQSFTGFRITDVGELRIGNAQEVGKLLPVGGRLVEQGYELTVREHRPGIIGLQKLLDVLADTRIAGSAFTCPLPLLKQEVGAVLAPEEQVDLVYENERHAALLAVAEHAVVDGVEHDEHTHGAQVLAEIVDVVADVRIVGCDVRLIRKGIERTIGKQLDRKGKFLGFGFGLSEQWCGFSTSVSGEAQHIGK